MENSYTDKVFDFLYNMQEDEWYVISRFVKTKNNEIFIEAVKLYMLLNKNTSPKYNGITFSDDYSKIKKQSINKEFVAAQVKKELINTNN